jgi:hypothetical protein
MVGLGAPERFAILADRAEDFLGIVEGAEQRPAADPDR